MCPQPIRRHRFWINEKGPKYSSTYTVATRKRQYFSITNISQLYVRASQCRLYSACSHVFPRPLAHFHQLFDAYREMSRCTPKQRQPAKIPQLPRFAGSFDRQFVHNNWIISGSRGVAQIVPSTRVWVRNCPSLHDLLLPRFATKRC